MNAKTKNGSAVETGDQVQLSFLENEMGQRTNHLIIKKDGASICCSELGYADSFYIVEELLLTLNDIAARDKKAGNSEPAFDAKLNRCKLALVNELFEDAVNTISGRAFQAGFRQGLEREANSHRAVSSAIGMASKLEGQLTAEKELGPVIHKLADAATTTSEAKKESILGSREIQHAISKAVA